MGNILGGKFNAMTEMDRRTWLAAIFVTFSKAKNLTDFASFLLDDAVLARREEYEELAFDRVIQDFLASYPRFCETDDHLAKQILEKFTGLLFQKEEDIDINNVFLWLQALSDSRLLLDTVELVATRQWRPHGDCEPLKRKRFELLCRRSRASLWRRSRSYDAARNELSSLLVEWKEFDATEKKELSIIEYEIGYMGYLLGDADESAKVLFDGARHAEEMGDTIGKIINSFCGYNSLYQGRKMSTENAKTFFNQYLAEMLEQNALKPREPRVVGWLFTMSHRLFEIACEENDEQMAEKYGEDVLRNELVQRGKNDLTYRLIRKSDAARLATVKSDWSEALRNWATFLHLELHGFQECIEQDLVDFHHTRPEQALCYREAGTVLRRLGENDQARRVWTRGLECPDDAGNKFFKEDIRTLLRQLS